MSTSDCTPADKCQQSTRAPAISAVMVQYMLYVTVTVLIGATLVSSNDFHDKLVSVHINHMHEFEEVILIAF